MMKNVINVMGSQLTRGTSRRGFIGTIGKVALGAGALAAGVELTTNSASAGVCCPQPYCNTCFPAGQDGWCAEATCCVSGSGLVYQCEQCFHYGIFACTVVTTGGYCPQ